MGQGDPRRQHQSRIIHVERSISAVTRLGRGQSWNVRFVPKADIGGAAKERLFNHLIGAGKERGRDFEAERFGRF